MYERREIVHLFKNSSGRNPLPCMRPSQRKTPSLRGLWLASCYLVVVSADLRRDGNGHSVIPFRVDSCRGQFVMPQENRSSFQPVALPHLGRVRVPELVRMPVRNAVVFTSPGYRSCVAGPIVFVLRGPFRRGLSLPCVPLEVRRPPWRYS